jgi:hypothetical protein
MGAYSKVVTQGMKRVCDDFSPIVGRHGFVRTKPRAWVRLNPLCADVVYFHRHGSTYGAPINASVSIRVMLSIRVLNHPAPGSGIMIISDHARRPNGYGYHHRFNAETWSTYDRCLDELGLFMTEIAEPWFAEWGEPEKLLTHPELTDSAREALEEALSGGASPDNVAMSLHALGVKRRAAKLGS